jgi:hypothetical protein
MMILKETMYLPNQEPKITEKSFGSKREIIKVLKKMSPLPGKTMYQLSKYNEAECEFHGIRHVFVIYNPVVEARES